MRLRSLHHVSSPFAGGDQDALRAFYGQVLGLRELPTPSALGHLGLVWFSAGEGSELHFFRGSVDHRAQRHFCFDIADLEETRKRLQGAGHQPYDDAPIPGRPRFFCRDPAGNLVEFTSIEEPHAGQRS